MTTVQYKGGNVSVRGNCSKVKGGQVTNFQWLRGTGVGPIYKGYLRMLWDRVYEPVAGLDKTQKCLSVST